MPSEHETLVVGAGMTGLAAGIGGGYRVLEGSPKPGGLCASYERDGFRFETGGGHWIFPGDPLVETTFDRLARLRRYSRRSSVFFTGGLQVTEPLKNLFVPYPIQNNLWALPTETRVRALSELSHEGAQDVQTLDGWLRSSFGPTLHGVFFGPFHERYTGGLHREVAPQDGYKSPVDIKAVQKGATRPSEDEVGYNMWFAYPVNGLNSLIDALAERCTVSCGTSVTHIDLQQRLVTTAGGVDIPYGTLISTIPLDELVRMSALDASEADPASAVLVLNLGVKLPETSTARHGYHWLYVPDSRSGFHRIGYYSNVDSGFLPCSLATSNGYASLYVETGFRREHRPSEADLARKCAEIRHELVAIGMVDKVLVETGAGLTARTPGEDPDRIGSTRSYHRWLPTGSTPWADTVAGDSRASPTASAMAYLPELPSGQRGWRCLEVQCDHPQLRPARGTARDLGSSAPDHVSAVGGDRR